VLDDADDTLMKADSVGIWTKADSGGALFDDLAYGSK
jgi:hypothetical protein